MEDNENIVYRRRISPISEIGVRVRPRASLSDMDYNVTHSPHRDKKENKIFLVYKEIQMRSVAKSYMRKGFLIYEEMRKYLTILKRPSIIYYFATDPSDFPYI
jgi:hypothetical protein